MHFWIDKRSVCGQQRRPPPLFASPRPYGLKPRYCSMVTPVHRFQRIESMQLELRRGAEGSRGLRYGRGRRPGRASSRLQTDGDEGGEEDDDEEEEEEEEGGGGRGEEERGVHVHLTDASSANAPGEDACLTRLGVPSGHASRRTSANSSSAYSRLPDNFNLFRMGGVNWCVWAAFIVITMLLVPAHLYLKNFDYRGELIGVFFVIILLFLVCFSVSLFHTKTRAILLHRLNLEDDARGCAHDAETSVGASSSSSSPFRRRPLFPNSLLRPPPPRRLSSHPAVRVSVSTPDLLINGRVASGERSRASRPGGLRRGGAGGLRCRPEAPTASDAGGDPPPYHVAVLLPAPSSSPTSRHCETPPPAYDVVQ